MANGTIAASQLEMLTQSGTGIVTIVPPATNTNRTLTLPDATGTVVALNSSGYLTTPSQPVFSVIKEDGSVTGTTGTTVILFNTVYVNISSSYSVGTGRFTAPVAGTYYFSAMGMLDTSVTTNGDLQVCLRKNGSNIAISNPPMDGTSVGGMNFAVSAAITMAASDYVDVGFYASNNASKFYAGGGAFNNFSGYLLG